MKLTFYQENILKTSNVKNKKNSVIQKIYIEYLACATHCARHYGITNVNKSLIRIVSNSN